MSNERDISVENMILKVRVGSHLFGTSTPESDLDYEGIFMPSAEMLYGLKACKEVDLGTVDKDASGRNTKDAIDFKLREYREFVRLALQNNPNILNILFTDNFNVMFSDKFGDRLRRNAKLFPHKGGLCRYLAYGRSQMKKMVVKPKNYNEIKDALGVLSMADPKTSLIEVVFGCSIDGKEKLFVDRGVGKHIGIGDMNFERGVSVKKVLASLNYRLDRVSSRKSLWEEYGYDVKFGSNLIQILRQGIELAETGKIKFPLKYADEILDIKRGSYELGQLNELADNLVDRLEVLIDFDEHVLAKKPRYDRIEKFVISEVVKWSAQKLIAR